MSGFEPFALTDSVGRFLGFFRNSNASGGYATGALLSFMPLAFARRPLDEFPRLRTVARCLLPALLWALVLTDSQAAYLGVMAGLVAWPLLMLSKRLSPWLVIAVMLISSLVIVSVVELQTSNSVLERGLVAIGYKSTRIPKRLALLESRLQTIEQRPLTGVGVGQIEQYVLETTAVDHAAGAHFTPLEIVAETGLLGLSAVALIVLAILQIMQANMRLPFPPGSGWLPIHHGLTMALVGLLVFGLAHDIQTSRTLWLILTLIVGQKRAFLAGAPERLSVNSLSI